MFSACRTRSLRTVTRRAGNGGSALAHSYFFYIYIDAQRCRGGAERWVCRGALPPHPCLLLRLLLFFCFTFRDCCFRCLVPNRAHRVDEACVGEERKGCSLLWLPAVKTRTHISGAEFIPTKEGICFGFVWEVVVVVGGNTPHTHTSCTKHSITFDPPVRTSSAYCAALFHSLPQCCVL